MKTCYLCHRPVKTFLKTKNRSIVRCDSCKLTYTRDATSGPVLREDSEKFTREYLIDARFYNEYFEQVIETIRKYKKPTRVLDVGCGVGLFLQKVKANGWNGVGVDMSKPAVTYARNHGLEVHLGRIEQSSFKTETFDVITLFQTIEHLEDPLKILKKLHSLLKVGGVLLITTPSETSFLARILGKFWFGYRNIEHLYFYNKQSLTAMQKKVGFKKITIRTESSRKLSLPWVLTRIFEYYYNQKSPLASVVLKSRAYWKYLNWITFREPAVNLVSIAFK